MFTGSLLECQIRRRGIGRRSIDVLMIMETRGRLRLSGVVRMMAVTPFSARGWWRERGEEREGGGGSGRDGDVA